MIQKIIKVGNSLAATLPKQLLSTLELSHGDLISVNALGVDEISIKKAPMGKKNLTAGITPEFVASVDEFIKAYRPALEELAHK